jgi:alpha-beta hydrolase superfamily lysophospholipase
MITPFLKIAGKAADLGTSAIGRLNEMEFIEMRDGYEIWYREDPVENPRGIVVITHGFAEHAGRYDHVTAYLNGSGYHVVRYDLRGHGRNKERGYLDRFESYVEDLGDVVRDLGERYPEVPLVTFGHSMGGLITAIFGSVHPEMVKAQILSGPALGKLPSAEKLQPAVMKVLSGVAGGIMLKNPVGEGICGNRQIYIDYINDPLVLHKASIKLYYQFLFRGVEIVRESEKDYGCPCLIVHGKEDPIVPISISKSFYRAIKSQKKDLIEYEGLYHEILNEDKRDLVLKDITDWLDTI